MNDDDHLEIRALQILTSHIGYIRNIDDLLDQLNELLNLYQPPKTGKIRIERWKRTKGDASVIAPMAVQWIQDRATLRWRGVVISTFKLSRSGKSARAFHDHHDRIKRYLSMAQELLQLRSAAFTRIETYRRAMMLAERANLPQLLAISAALDADLQSAGPDVRARAEAESDELLDDE